MTLIVPRLGTIGKATARRIMAPALNGEELPAGAESTGRIVVALFRDRSRAEDAIRDLKNAGFTNEQLGVATQDTIGFGASTQEPGEGSPGAELPTGGVAEDSTSGAITGGIVGGLLGLISSVLLPGVGPLVAGGVLASTLMGIGVGAAAGGVVGALVSMGIPEEHAQYFAAGLKEGRTLLTVRTMADPASVLAILEQHGADLGPSRVERADDGRGERRSRAGAGYTGPERRLARI
jgi:hypothetical protein